MILSVTSCIHMPYHPSVLSSRTQLWRTCGVGARPHFAREFTGCKLRYCAFGAHSTCSDAECRGGRRQERFRLNASKQRHQHAFTLCQRFHAVVETSVFTSLLSICPFGRLRKKRFVPRALCQFSHCTFLQNMHAHAGTAVQPNVGSATTDREMWSATSCIIGW